MDMHGVAEVPDDPLGAHPASLGLIGIPPLAMQNLVIVDGHATSAHPFVAIAGVNMIEIGQVEGPQGISRIAANAARRLHLCFEPVRLKIPSLGAQ